MPEEMPPQISHESPGAVVEGELWSTKLIMSEIDNEEGWIQCDHDTAVDIRQ